MGFSKKFKQLGEVLNENQIQHIQGLSFGITEEFHASDYFKNEIKITLESVPYNVSEFSICETLIYPILREVWKPYLNIFNIWSRALVKLNLHVKGYPDYLIAKRSALSSVVFEKPYLAVVEAKKDDFSGAWGQCLAEMSAIQQLNDNKLMPVYGITSSGLVWQFGKLEGDTFTQYATLFTIEDLDRLFSGLKTLFELCRLNIE
ncbi:MAG: hypothetical protein U5M51_00280 [Emticicia sp.]|nr:hypothetical protein [Emticicia sp.]